MNRKTILVLAALWVGSLAMAYYTGVGAGGGKVRLPWSKQEATGAAKSSGGSGVAASASESSVGPWAKPRDGRGAGASGGPADQEAVVNRIKAAFANPNAIERTQQFVAALEQLDEKGFADAAQWMSENADGMSGRWQFMLLMYGWGRKAPEQALAWAKENKQDRAAFSVLSSWAEVSPDKAVAWAQANAPVGEDGKPTDNWNMLGVVHGLAKSDLGAAAKAVESMNFGDARGQALEMVLDGLWKQDQKAAEKWVSAIQDERLRAGAAGKVANRLANEDVQKAAAFTETLTDLNAQGRAATEVIDRWTRDQPDAAGEWLNRFPKSAEMDPARERFAYGIDERDPVSSLAWAQTITDTGRREDVLRHISRDWLRRDNQNAKSYLQTQPNLPNRVKEMLR